MESEKVNGHAVSFSAPFLLFLVGKLRFLAFYCDKLTYGLSWEMNTTYILI